MKIEEANNSDAKLLTNLTIRSKAHWNYSTAQIEQWREDLTISKSYIGENFVHKLIHNDVPIGYYSYFKINQEQIQLDNLFVDPEYIGNGFGKLLMEDFLQRLKTTKFKKVILESDPNAESFYLNFGFKVVGQLKTSVKNRFLPIMELKL